MNDIKIIQYVFFAQGRKIRDEIDNLYIDIRDL